MFISMRVYTLIFFLLLMGNVFVLSICLTPRALGVWAYQAGKGSVVVVRRGGATIVVGGGSDASVLRTLGQALPPWERVIDVLVIPAGETETSGGVPDILARYTVRETVSLVRGEELSIDGTPIPLR